VNALPGYVQQLSEKSGVIADLINRYGLQNQVDTGDWRSTASVEYRWRHRQLAGQRCQHDSYWLHYAVNRVVLTFFVG